MLTLAVLVFAAPANAGQLVTWETTSSHVDPAKEPMGGPPDGEAREPGLRVNVYLPDGYDGKRCFPVLYLVHGGFGAYDYWAHATKLDVLNVAKGFRGLIVMPESGAVGGGIDYWNRGKRGDPGWASHHLSDVIPLAERRLKICPGRRSHAIGGYSAGGLTAVLHASARPGYFGSVAAFSGLLAPKRPEFWTAFSVGASALWPTYFATDPLYHKIFGDPVDQGFYWDGHDPLTLATSLRHTRVFFSHGDGVPRGPSDLDHPIKPLEVEAVLMARDFQRAADRAGLRYARFAHSGVHDYPYFKLALPQALRWGFFKQVTESPRSWTYKTVSTRGHMWGLRFEFARPPETLETFARDGSRLTGAGRGTVTLRRSRSCELTADLPFDLQLPDGCLADQLRLTVRPRHTRTAARIRFRFLATSIREDILVPVEGATVAFAGKRTRTDADGRATIVARLRRPGTRRARVLGDELRPGAATITVKTP